MTPITQADLAALLESTRITYPQRHPFETLLLPDTVEEAVFGTAQQQKRTAQTDERGAAVSPDALRQQLRAAELTGQQGEEAFNLWLEATGHEEDDFEWVARTHARATHDFHMLGPRWAGASGELFIDVKSTRGAFDAPVHMSMAEIRWAATHPNHRIARVHGLATPPRLAILGGVHELAKTLMETVVAGLPEGVAIDAFEIEVGKLPVELTTELDPCPDGRRPHPGTAAAEHVAHPWTRHAAGDDRAPAGARARLPVPAARAHAAGLAGPRATRAPQGDLRARVLLASAPLSLREAGAAHPHGVLDGQAHAQPRARRGEPEGAARAGVDVPRGVGVPDASAGHAHGARPTTPGRRESVRLVRLEVDQLTFVLPPEQREHVAAPHPHRILADVVPVGVVVLEPPVGAHAAHARARRAA